MKYQCNFCKIYYDNTTYFTCNECDIKNCKICYDYIYATRNLSNQNIHKCALCNNTYRCIDCGTKISFGCKARVFYKQFKCEGC